MFVVRFILLRSHIKWDNHSKIKRKYALEKDICYLIQNLEYVPDKQKAYCFTKNDFLRSN